MDAILNALNEAIESKNNTIKFLRKENTELTMRLEEKDVEISELQLEISELQQRILNLTDEARI